jgi:Double zinc ribbon
MDELDRLYRRLVQNIRAGFPELLTRPFEVSQVYQQIVPYRTNRRELGFDSNEEYELAVLQLVAGVRGFLAGDEDMQRTLRQELESANPELRAFRVYATSAVTLAPEALRALEQQPQTRPVSREIAAAGTPARSPAEQVAVASRTTEAVDLPSVRAPRPAAPPPAPAPAPPPPARADSRPTSAAPPPPAAAMTMSKAPTPHAGSGEPCRYCAGALPEGRKIVFCPHCGHNLTVQHCPACGSELEIEWKFCVACGRDVG